MKLLRRLFWLLLAAAALTAAYARFLEPRRLVVHEIALPGPGGAAGRLRLVHVSDLHYKGDARQARQLVDRLNDLRPDFVCFTGDLIEHPEYQAEALDFVRQVNCPVYGVPGNHEHWSGAPQAPYVEAFAATGGAWLADGAALWADGRAVLCGVDGWAVPAAAAWPEGRPRLLLVHYPAAADTVAEGAFDLVLAGHSHGGQVRLPGWGALVLPDRVAGYDRGLFRTRAGPLCVSAGVGTYGPSVRFFCPPEITLITLGAE